jgi:hypothetical protein
VFYTSKLEAQAWYFIVQNYVGVNATLQFITPNDSVPLGSHVVRRDLRNLCPQNDPTITYRVHDVQCACITSGNWNDLTYSANYPSPPGGRDPPIFFPYQVNSAMCFVVPDYMGEEDILFSFNLVWNSMDVEVTNQIWDIPKEDVQAGTEFQFEEGYNFFHYTNSTAESSIVAVKFSEGCENSAIYFTSDDWKLPWIKRSYYPDYVNPLWASYTVGYGWYILAYGDITCSVTIDSVPTTLVIIDNEPVTKTVPLLATEGLNVGLVHVKVSKNVTAVRLDFSENVDFVWGSASQMPFDGLVDYAEILSLDYVSLVHQLGYMFTL